MFIIQFDAKIHFAGGQMWDGVGCGGECYVEVFSQMLLLLGVDVFGF